MSDILLIGKGFLGEKIHSLFGSSITMETADIVPGTDFFLDVTNPGQCSRAMRKASPETVILTASLAGVDYCERNAEKAFAVNGYGVKNVAEAIREFSPEAKLVYFSTDYAFDGKKGNYNENDSVNPLGVYAKSKVKGEREAMRLDDFLVLRVSTLYGFNSREDKMTYTRMIIENLRAGKKILASKQVTSPTFIDDCARAALALVEKKQCGIFHVAGPESFSRSAWAQKVAESFDLDSGLIEEVAELPGQVAPRPADSSLDTGKLLSAGIKMSPPSVALEKMRGQMEKEGVL